MKTYLLLVPLLLSSLAIYPILVQHTIQASIGKGLTIESSSLLFDKINVTAVQTSPGCYKGVVLMNLTNNGAIPQTIGIQSFAIVTIQKNMVVLNSTNTQTFVPNNQIQALTLYPQIPVLLKLSFINVCIPSLSTIQLVYFDGSNFLSWSLP